MADPEFTYWKLWVQPMVPAMFEAFLNGATEEQVRDAAMKTFNVGVDLVNESSQRACTHRRDEAVWRYVDSVPPGPPRDDDREDAGSLPMWPGV